MRLLLVEDEEVLGRTTTQALRNADFTVDWTRTGEDAKVAVRRNDYDAILLDLGLPDIRGEVFIEQLRARRDTVSVIVMTARGQFEDRVAVLDLGADDYMVKPVNIQELGARLRAVKRRTSAALDPGSTQTVGPLTLHPSSRTALWHGQQAALTSREFDVLEALVMRRPNVLSRAQLESVLYGWGDEVESNAIDVYVHFLRRKLAPHLIVTVRGKGYRLAHDADVPDAPGSDDLQAS